MHLVAGRPGVRGGGATRGFRPGSAQALVALVLGLAAGVAGLRRGEPLPAVLFLLLGVLGGVALVRLYVPRRRARPRSGGRTVRR